MNMGDWFDYQADIADGLADGAGDDESRDRLADSARCLRRRAIAADLADEDAAETDRTEGRLTKRTTFDRK